MAYWKAQEVTGMPDEAILTTALAAAISAGASYAEARGETQRQSQVMARDGAVERVIDQTDTGWGIRVAVPEGGWGFAAAAQWDADSAAATAQLAVEIARASAATTPTPIALDGMPIAQGEYATTVARDPFAVPVDEQIDLVRAASSAMRAADPRVVAASAAVTAWQTEKRFINSLGAELRQTIVETEGGLRAYAQDESGYTYPRSLDNRQQAGWEFIESLDLRNAAGRVGREAAELVVAPWVPEGPQTVILGADFVSLIIHESCGHPTELDRVLGWEAAFAGTSFLMPEMRDTFRYGSPHVTIRADATTPGGLGTFGWDDEGTPAQAWDLIRDGIFVGYLANRESAAVLGMPSNGCGRASGWNRMPIVRMVNVSLVPGHGSVEDLIGGVERGLYIDTPKSWSLDDKRMNFHFSGELCREIVNGQLGELRKGAAFQARTPEFWGACQAVAGPADWRLKGFASCAKGEPLQLAHVAHGAAPILIGTLGVSRG
jgi:TldD protein